MNHHAECLADLVDVLTQKLADARREARTDPGTRLGNRRAWDETTQQLRASGTPFAVVMFDVANLKAANTVLGHVGADELLDRVAGGIRTETDTACRIGGDEFAIALPGVSAADARKVRDRIEARVGTVELGAGVPLFVSGAVAAWSPNTDGVWRAALVDLDARIERRKTKRKVELGAPVTREATLALVS